MSFEPKEPPRITHLTAAEILEQMAVTFRERNKMYGENYRMVAKLVAILWPHGVPSALVTTDAWHLFELKLVKLSRFAVSNLTHRDSIHDDGVYSAMIEALILEKEHEQALCHNREQDAAFDAVAKTLTARKDSGL